MTGLGLTPDEIQEFNNHPIGSITEPLPTERLALRRHVAQLLYHQVMSGGTPHPDITSFSNAYPMWQFWSSRQMHVMGRAYGVVRLANGTLALKLFQPGGDPYAENVVLPVDMIAVEDWNPIHLAHIQRAPDSDIFLDPCGFIHLLQN